MTSNNPFQIEINNPDPTLQFNEDLKPVREGSSKYLTVRGQRVFDFGVASGSIPFVYKHIKESTPLQPGQLAELLRNGLEKVDITIIQSVEKLLPSGHYTIGLIRLIPKYIVPSQNQLESVGYGDVRTQFYRAGIEKVDEHGEIQQAIMSLFSPKSVKKNTVEKYKKSLLEGVRPTALAISIAEGKHVMTSAGWDSPDCISLMHFLIDGHQKVHAASEIRKPMTLLSFLFDYKWAGLITTHPHNPSMKDVMFERYYSK